MPSKNEDLFQRAQKHIPGGVNSPVRAFGSVGGTPRFFERGQGAYFWDADGQKYIDYVGSWGPLILGHAHPETVNAIQAAAANGLSFGAPTELEIEFADLLTSLLPSLEQVRLVSSGTEATMSAIRLARGYTGRNKIIKFEGCYHGHADSLLVKAGSGLLTFGNPSSAGVTAATAADTIVVPYNDIAALEAIFAQCGHEIAALIVEPCAGNMNLVKPDPEFIQAVRALTQQCGAVLIYDEVMTGFRVSLNCAQGLHGITPDLTCLGKIIGGGMPLAAFGGKAEIMNQLAPNGPIYQAGTLSGNPLAVTAGLSTLKHLFKPGVFANLEQKTQLFVEGINQMGQEFNVPICAQSIGGMFGLYFTKQAPKNFSEVMACDQTAFNHFFHAMLKAGIYFAPSAFEAGFMSTAHSNDDIQFTHNIIRHYLQNK